MRVLANALGEAPQNMHRPVILAISYESDNVSYVNLTPEIASTGPVMEASAAAMLPFWFIRPFVRPVSEFQCRSFGAGLQTLNFGV